MDINLLNEAKEIKDILIDLRRDFHENPELGFEEWRTSGKIKEFLTNEGIEYIETAKTGVCGIIRGTLEDDSKKDRCIALRSDIDGLPMNDKKSCSYSSKIPGRMHACGHDAHMSILLGAAKLLNRHKDKFSGTVKLLFEPAEETTGGAPLMIEDGVLENPRVQKIIGLHVEETLNVGEIMIKKGVVNAASNPFTIKIKGRGGHGAYPHMAIDPIVMASQVVLGLQTIVSREIKPVNPAVVTVGSINGGTAQNIIPDEVTLKGVIRTMTLEDRAYAKERLKEIATSICKAMRGECEVIIEESYPCLYNDDDMVDLVKETAKEIIGEENVKEQAAPKLGVESFAYFALERESAFYFLGARNEARNIIHSAHNSMFDVDEDLLPIGVSIQSGAALKYLTRD
ncbi:M20 metallopeptidase family protein [Clostridium sp. B9]|uniref:M20 metallopeptidase family protein n=1 Tax=Clostridium sp. B9 TaxID=3423224 RepID=UPI003D2F43E4